MKEMAYNDDDKGQILEREIHETITRNWTDFQTTFQPAIKGRGNIQISRSNYHPHRRRHFYEGVTTTSNIQVPGFIL